MIPDTFYHMPSSLIRRKSIITGIRMEPTLISQNSILRGGAIRGRPSDVRRVIDLQTRNMVEEEWRSWIGWFTEIGFESPFTFFIPIRSYPAGFGPGIGPGTRGIRPRNWDDHFNDIEDLSDTLPVDNAAGVLNADAEAGDTVISVKFDLPAAANQVNSIAVDDYFSIKHGTSRAPMHYASTRHSPSDANGIVHISIAPPGLRSNVNAGELVNFFEPRGTYQLQIPFALTVEQALISAPVLQLIETPEVIRLPYVDRVVA